MKRIHQYGEGLASRSSGASRHQRLQQNLCARASKKKEEKKNPAYIDYISGAILMTDRILLFGQSDQL